MRIFVAAHPRADSLSTNLAVNAARRAARARAAITAAMWSDAEYPAVHIRFRMPNA